jgi:hypothetical protein
LIVVAPELVELPPGVVAWEMRRIDPPVLITSFWPSRVAPLRSKPEPTLAMTMALVTETRAFGLRVTMVAFTATGPAKVIAATASSSLVSR